MTPPRLYLVTDRRLVAELPAAVEAALAALPRGVAAVQLREKELPARELYALACAVRAACVRHGAPLLVNDRLDVARAAGADGAHLGGGSVEVEEARALLPPGAIVAASTHDEAELARRRGADFVVFGPVFAVPGKGPAVGLDALASASRHGVPVVALGGIDASTAAAAVRAGACGVAAIRSWLGTGDPASAARALHEACRGAW